MGKFLLKKIQLFELTNVTFTSRKDIESVQI